MKHIFLFCFAIAQLCSALFQTMDRIFQTMDRIRHSVQRVALQLFTACPLRNALLTLRVLACLVWWLFLVAGSIKRWLTLHTATRFQHTMALSKTLCILQLAFVCILQLAFATPLISELLIVVVWFCAGFAVGFVISFLISVALGPLLFFLLCVNAFVFLVMLPAWLARWIKRFRAKTQQHSWVAFNFQMWVEQLVVSGFSMVAFHNDCMLKN